MGLRIGIDVGGTFTDFILLQENGQLTEAKTPTRADEPVEAIKAGLTELGRRNDQSLDELVCNCDLIVLGTTAPINALIQHKGAKTGLICTAGFRDTLRMRLGHKERRYDFWYGPPPVLVPRYLTLPVRERVLSDGSVLTSLNEADVQVAIHKFEQEGVAAIAVCLLWSFLNPAHERRVGELVAAALPDVYLTLSVDLLPEIRYYDRISTTAVNAYLGPIVRDYVGQVEAYFGEIGFAGELRYLQANGGICAAEAFIKRSVIALNSGPAAAPVAGLFLASRLGHNDVVTIDMGGTSFDAALVKDGQPAMVKNTDVRRYRIGSPMLDIHTIGAGGGSIAWVDEGLLRVGPQSAEADPGPACYQRGGEQATVTDADLVLGYLSPKGLIGGKLPLSREAAETAIEKQVAKPLGLSIEEAALAIFRIVNQNMTRGISEISLERGHDPRDFVLVVAGGAGPVHAARLAKELNIQRVIIPRVSSTFCAFGAITSDLRHDYGLSFPARFQDVDIAKLNDLFKSLEDQAQAELVSEGVDENATEMRRTAEVRYVDEIYETTVPVPSGRFNSDSLQTTEEAFHQRHEQLYSYAQPDALVEFTQIAVSGLGKVSKPALQVQVEESSGDPKPAAHRAVRFEEDEEPRQTPIYEFAQLGTRLSIEGPAILEEENTTIVIIPGAKLQLVHEDIYLMMLVND